MTHDTGISPDEAGVVRSGEELDAARVREFICRSLPGVSGEIAVRQFPGGFSNLTYLVSVGDNDFILRRPPFGRKATGAHDMGREFRVLSALKPVFHFCPTPLVHSEDEGIIGAPFYLMERVRGVILRNDLPPDMGLTPDRARTLSGNLIRTLCRLHAVDYRTAGLEELGRGDGYASRQVVGWSRRYADARTDDASSFDGVIRWLHDRIPERSSAPALIHNDYKFDNTVLDPNDPTRIIGLLDWEMATIGDPLMDLGSSLAYWVEADDPPELQAIRTMPTNVAGMLTRKEQVALYGEISGIAIDNFDFYYCFGLFRLAVIAQQIYYRYFHGQTRDPRFKNLVHAVAALEKTALGVIERSDL